MKHKPIDCPDWLIVAAVIVLLLMMVDTEARDWTKADTARQSIYTALLITDMLTTIDIKDNEEIQEVGVGTRYILGHNPEPLQTVGYFTVLGVANYYVARALPHGKFRTTWQVGSAIISGSYVVNNWKLGLRPTFK